MIGSRFLNYVTSISILIEIAAALNSDGICTSTELYTESVPSIQTYKTTVPYSRKCGIFSTRICYDYRDRIDYKPVVHNVQKTRIKKQCCQGYHRNDEGNCMKNECDPATLLSDECLNGICTPIGICLCNEGFVKNNSSLLCELVCDEGFELNALKLKCIPKCKDGCVNGNCSSPYNCICNAGYHKNDEGCCVKNECDPATPKSNECLNGICTSIGVCLCNEGFAKNNSSLLCELVCDEGYELNMLRSECLPKCEDGCVNGICVSPDNCTCNEGFEFNEELKQCMPACDEECVNSDCKYPNVCTCWSGFSQINSTHCEIACGNCNHGYCRVANVCECDIGYHMHNEECVENECTPDLMEDSCENGYCSDNGVCMCDFGYEKNISMACAPICSLECVNGFCSEPEICKCYGGYGFSATNSTDDGSNCTNCTSSLSWNLCVAVCDDCRYGECVAGVCNCIRGYVEHPHNRGKCILPEELIQLSLINSTSMPSFLWVIFIMVSLGIILIAAGGFAYWRHVQANSYVCNSEVIYRKDDDIIDL